MTARQPLYKTMVNAKDTMLQLREEGYTNKEIAEQMDISYQTVLKYIGAQPGNVPRKRVEHDVPHETAEIAPPPCLAVTGKNVTLKGELASYIVDGCCGTILVSMGDSTMLLDFEDLDKIMNELSAIRHNINSVKTGAEMW